MVNARRMGPETGFQPDSECPVRVRDGTLNLQPSGRPGSVDEKSATPLVRSRRDWRWVDRWKAAGAIWDAMGQARGRAVTILWDKVQVDLGEAAQALLWAVLVALGVLAAGAVLGAAIGGAVGALAGGVGAAPGAVVGAKVGVDLAMAALAWLGLAFLVQGMASGLAEVGNLASRGVERAAESVLLDGAQRFGAFDEGVELLAQAAAEMVIVVLQGIVAWLTRGAATAASGTARASIGSARTAAAAGGTTALAEAQVAALVAKLRGNPVLPESFAAWVERNWRTLVENPRLRPTVGSASAEARSGAAVTPSQLKAMRDGRAAPEQPTKPADVPKPRLARERVPCFHPYDKRKFARMTAEGQRSYLKEMAEQLRRQEEAINSMSAAEFKAARDAFAAKGRNPIAEAAQSDYRDVFERDLRESLRESLLNDEVGAAHAKAMAEVRAKEIMGKLAALHEPDMVAGGWAEHDPKAMGRADVNQSIGGSWNQSGRIQALDKAAGDAISSGKGSQLMNVTLEPCRGKGMR